MKKIKILHAFVIGVIVLFAISYIVNIYLIFFSKFMDQFDGLYDDFIFGYYTQFVNSFSSIFTFIGLIYIKKGLSITLRNGFFNTKSAKNFITAAKWFFLSGIIGGAFEIAVFIHTQGSIGFASFGQSLLLIIIAFVLYIIVDIIDNGNELKLDNELTI